VPVAVDDAVPPLGSSGVSAQFRPARLVRLWNDNVAVDEAGNVYCHACMQFVPVAVLSPYLRDHDVVYRPWWSE
jgi:hypothetical protein